MINPREIHRAGKRDKESGVRKVQFIIERLRKIHLKGDI